MMDKNLDLILSELRSSAPTEFQMQKWKNAVHIELRKNKKTNRVFWLQLAAASIVGFFVGAVVFTISKPKDSFQNLALIEGENATIEYVYTKNN